MDASERLLEHAQKLEQLLNETWRYRQRALALDTLKAAHGKVLEALGAVPHSSRGRPPGDAARLGLTAALMADVILSHVDHGGDDPAKIVRRAVEVAYLAGMTAAAGRLAADKKAQCGSRAPSELDKLVTGIASEGLSAPAAARVLKSLHNIHRAPLTLERRIRLARKKPKP